MVAAVLCCAALVAIGPRALAAAPAGGGTTTEAPAAASGTSAAPGTSVAGSASSGDDVDVPAWAIAAFGLIGVVILGGGLWWLRSNRAGPPDAAAGPPDTE